MSTPLLLTTHPGIEDLVAAELAERCAAAGVGHGAVELRADGLAGRVRAVVEAERTAALGIASGLRSVFHLLRPVDVFDLDPVDPLGAIRARLATLALPELEAEETSFRVRCERQGQHLFTSEQVAAAAGAGVLDRLRRPVRMTGFDVLLRVDVRDQRVAVAVQHSHSALADRFAHLYNQRSSLRPTLAWSMLRLLGQRPASLLDPFCGAGTILAEAAQVLPGVRLWGSDFSDRAVEGAGLNLEAAGVSAELRCGDALDLQALWGGPMEAVVSNPPFGLQLGARIDFYRFYPRLLDSLAAVVPPGGRVALLVWKRAIFNRTAWRSGGPFRSIHVRIVEMGNVFPGLFVMERQ
jgi:23S rRNA G2445 N2-methylase RlmL